MIGRTADLETSLFGAGGRRGGVGTTLRTLTIFAGCCSSLHVSPEPVGEKEGRRTLRSDSESTLERFGMKSGA